MSQTLTVTEVTARLSELVALVEATQTHVNITRGGEPAAVLMSYTELTGLRETIAILSDSRTMEDLRRGEAEIAAGQTVTADELREALLARRHLAT